MRALGLNASNSHHEQYYRLMRVCQQAADAQLNGADSRQEEAIVVYNQLNSTRNNLMDDQRNDASVTPPFFWHHIRPERRRQAIIDIWQNARAGTMARQLFDRGATSGEHAPNWVTLWLLYSVFRSRDDRNNRNRRTDGSTSQSSMPSSAAYEIVTDPILGDRRGPSDSQIFDPARDRYVRR
jgi:hypothetical protein